MAKFRTRANLYGNKAEDLYAIEQGVYVVEAKHEAEAAGKLQDMREAVAELGFVVEPASEADIEGFNSCVDAAKAARETHAMFALTQSESGLLEKAKTLYPVPPPSASEDSGTVPLHNCVGQKDLRRTRVGGEVGKVQTASTGRRVIVKVLKPIRFVDLPLRSQRAWLMPGWLDFIAVFRSSTMLGRCGAILTSDSGEDFSRHKHHVDTISVGSFSHVQELFTTQGIRRRFETHVNCACAIIPCNQRKARRRLDDTRTSDSQQDRARFECRNHLVHVERRLVKPANVRSQ